MNSSSFQDKLFNYASVITIISFLIVIFLALLVLWPNFKELKILQGKTEEKKVELDQRQKRLLKFSEIKVKLEENEEDFFKIESALPEDPSLPSLFNYLQKVSSGSDLVLEKVGPFLVSSSVSAPGLKETVFSIEVSGSYSSLENFISVLEKSARLIEAENISFSSKEEKETTSFSLRIKVFSY